ncbi:hypothetical protein CTI14_07745 [Methylobacterium radiotolerans]|nr:hypothetical protein CTI14_07745 [Methylobacterium radiotolerans]
MGRGLGRQQQAVLAALRTLEEEHGPGWRTPADVIALVEAETQPASAAQAPDMDPEERLVRMQLAGCLRLVELGHHDYRVGVTLAEARLARFAEARREREEAARRQAEANRAPNQVRATPRAGEERNPSRVFALLERRGLVERQASCGRGALVRLAPAGGLP